MREKIGIKRHAEGWELTGSNRPDLQKMGEEEDQKGGFLFVLRQVRTEVHRFKSVYVATNPDTGRCGRSYFIY